MNAKTKQLARIDCAGGGQVWVDGATLYVGHMASPSGTSIYDIVDPKNPKLLTHIGVEKGWHSHKVRVSNGIMLINIERTDALDPNMLGGLDIYDVSRPQTPRLISQWRTKGKGVHRFDFDGRYAYISPTAEGFIGNIVMILDLEDPSKPTEVGRWWIPGQWEAGGEKRPWPMGSPEPRCHHPIRAGDHLFVSYWHHGFFILDIKDLSAPKLVSEYNVGPSYPHPTHTCLPLPRTYNGRRFMIMAQEDVAKLRPSAPAISWMFDITDLAQPIPVATIQVPGQDEDGAPQDKMRGCHQPSEVLRGDVVPFAWFAGGLQFFNLANPYSPKHVGSYLPEDGDTISSNDVTLDDRGLVYLVDRIRGVDIIETSLIQ